MGSGKTAQEDVEVGAVFGAIGAEGVDLGEFGAGDEGLKFSVAGVMAVAEAVGAAPPIEQVVVGFRLDVLRPGDDPFAEARKVEKAPDGHDQEAAGVEHGGQ